MAIKVVIDLDRITLDDLQTIEGMPKRNTASNAQLAKEVLWRFVVDDNGEYMPEKQARALVGGLGIGTAAKAMQEFSEAMNNMLSDVVPPPKEKQ